MVSAGLTPPGAAGEGRTDHKLMGRTGAHQMLIQSSTAVYHQVCYGKLCACQVGPIP